MAWRREKGWGAWGVEFRPDCNVVESGMGVFGDWTKALVGKAAAEEQRQEGARQALVTLVIEVDGMDVSNDEAILRDGEAIGYVSSGGYGHRVGRSMAMGYIGAEHAAPGTRVEVEILGKLYPAEVLAGPMYDPNGGRMRS